MIKQNLDDVKDKDLREKLLRQQEEGMGLIVTHSDTPTRATLDVDRTGKKDTKYYIKTDQNEALAIQGVEVDDSGEVSPGNNKYVGTDESGNYGTHDLASAISLGAWDGSSYSVAISYQAATDGFLVGVLSNTATADLFTLKTDSSDPPTSVKVNILTVIGGYYTFCCPIKKDDYFLMEEANTLLDTAWWIPLST